MRPPSKQARGAAAARALRAYGVAPTDPGKVSLASARAAATFPPLASAAAEQMRVALDTVFWQCPMLRLELPGPPKPMQRARPYVDLGGHIRKKLAEETRAFEQLVRTVALAEAMRERWPVGGFDGARYAVSLAFVLADDTGDVDNRTKSVFDACNKVVWYDDRHVCSLFATQRLAEPGERPRTEMTAWAMRPKKEAT